MYGLKEGSEAMFGNGYNALPIFKGRFDGGLAKQDAPLGDIIADSDGRYPGVAHRMADLIETFGNVSRRVKARNGSALMIVHDETPIVGAFRADRRRKF